MNDTAETLPLCQYLKQVNGPLLIAGPCSAESESQMLLTAKGIQEHTDCRIFRAGIWKPRTRPGSFEGIGSPGLNWLHRIKEETGFYTATEVAQARHTEACLRAGVDLLWLGARTTANPFSVQELADSLKGTSIPVFIKNPVNADIDLWCGAIERMARAGITSIGLIHRGFSTSDHSDYRNPPMWPLAIEMKRRFPEIRMINDPSHICGQRDTLGDVSQKATDLGFDGLMIETHHDPSQAWSDAKQQLTPEALSELLHRLYRDKESNHSSEAPAMLENLRHTINQLDDELIQILSQRMKLSNEIGQYKKQHQMAILQPTRWNEVLKRAVLKGRKHGLSKAFVVQYFKAMHSESMKHQKSCF